MAQYIRDASLFIENAVAGFSEKRHEEERGFDSRSPLAVSKGYLTTAEEVPSPFTVMSTIGYRNCAHRTCGRHSAKDPWVQLRKDVDPTPPVCVKPICPLNSQNG